LQILCITIILSYDNIIGSNINIMLFPPLYNIHIRINILFQQWTADLQRYIDELSAQREEVVGLVKLIPDTTARTVIELRYGLTGSGCQKVPWLDMEELMNYGRHSIFRYHRKGIDQLNQILKNGS